MRRVNEEPKNGTEIGRALVAWFRAGHRDMPWRRTRDPWAILVSELMLQQTTVATVLTRWPPFLERFPTPQAMAAAPQEETIAAWRGLGYYARARNLHRAATEIAARTDGFPRTAEELRQLPGIGAYTAAAVASIAFGEPVPVVDANVRRVAARLLAYAEDATKPAAARAFAEAASRWMDRGAAGDFNQAMMELGATVCTPAAPRCGECPVAAHCAARTRGTPERFPALPPRAKFIAAREVAVAIRRSGRLLVCLRPDTGSFAKMWELPRAEMNEGETQEEAALRIARELTGIRAQGPHAMKSLRHTVMNRRIELTVVECAAPKNALATPTQHAESRWLTPEEWLALPSSSTQHKIAAWMATHRRSE